MIIAMFSQMVDTPEEIVRISLGAFLVFISIVVGIILGLLKLWDRFKQFIRNTVGISEDTGTLIEELQHLRRDIMDVKEAEKRKKKEIDTNREIAIEARTLARNAHNRLDSITRI